MPIMSLPIRPIVLLGALTLVLGMAFGSAGTAQAADLTPSAPSAPATQPLTSPMVVVGFDRAVAEANGYEIRVDESGREYSVPKGTAASAAVPASEPILTGNCGSSWVYFTAIGNKTAELRTGFGVIHNAVGYSWTVNVTDQAGVGTLHWGGPLLLRRAWETTTLTQGATGYAIAQVNISSYATLVDGSVCHSLGPWDDTYYF